VTMYQVVVAWGPTPGASAYQVERVPDEEGRPGPFAPLATTAAGEHLDADGMSPATSYW
jgi:hypothetical protein